MDGCNGWLYGWIRYGMARDRCSIDIRKAVKKKKVYRRSSMRGEGMGHGPWGIRHEEKWTKQR
jgi:hypothetical protein